MKRILVAAACLVTFGGTVLAQDNARVPATRKGIEKRISDDIRALREEIEGLRFRRKARARLLAEVKGLEEEFKATPIAVPDDFRAVLPLNPMHERVFAIRGDLWHTKGQPRFSVWGADLWGHLDLWDEPRPRVSPRMRVHMMWNEHRAAAFNISNATREPATAILRVKGLPAGQSSIRITVHQVEWTDTRTGRVVAAALPEAQRAGRRRYVVSLPAGMTRQVWFMIDSEGALEGKHRGMVEVSIEGRDFRVPFEVTFYPIHFPDRPTLHFGGWDYTSANGVYGVTDENLPAFLEHCRDHFVDSPWARVRVIPRGGYDDKGNMVSEPRTDRFDAWVDRWPKARRLCIFPNFRTSFAGFELGTPEFETAVKDYATFWANHARKRGFEPEQVVWLIIDEPRDIETDKVIIAWAKTIRAAGTGIQVWEDPIHPDMSKAHPDLGSACHILCLNRTMFQQAPEKYGRYFMDARERGTTLEFYSCRGPARLLDPYAYYRMQAWSCWRQKAVGTSFWALGDNAGVSSWNEYIAPRTAYTPFFIDADSVTAGKHMEACREGIEDYEYLVMLERAVKAAEEAGRKDRAVRRARTLLDELPDRVLNEETFKAFWWRDPLDRTVADEARREILDALVRLGQNGAP